MTPVRHPPRDRRARLRAAIVAVAIASLAPGLACSPAHASSDVLSSLVGTNQNGGSCSNSNMLNNLRSNLDNAAARFAAALFPPASSSSMGCLSNITSLFSNVKNIFSGTSGFDINSVVSNMEQGVSNQISSAICGFARAALAQALRSLSGGLSGGGSSINYGSNTASSWSSIAAGMTAATAASAVTTTTSTSSSSTSTSSSSGVLAGSGL